VEQAPLRLVPLAPAAPVDPESATARVSALLPALPAADAEALARVVLSGRSRAEAAREMEIDAGELRLGLAAGRTALRRSVRPLPGSGWCTRAEVLVSDRLDGELDAAGAARLDAHLANCPRCAEHEQGVVQGQDRLISAFGRAEASNGRAEASNAPAPLALVPEDEPVPPGAADGLVNLSLAVILTLSALLVVAAIAFAVAALVP
jgi:hypothetical protein